MVTIEENYMLNNTVSLIEKLEIALKKKDLSKYPEENVKDLKEYMRSLYKIKIIIILNLQPGSDPNFSKKEISDIREIHDQLKDLMPIIDKK